MLIRFKNYAGLKPALLSEQLQDNGLIGRIQRAMQESGLSVFLNSNNYLRKRFHCHFTFK